MGAADGQPVADRPRPSDRWRSTALPPRLAEPGGLAV
jgi:hypothetical protein